MKQLILTFFAVILCYSLFFDNEPKVTPVDEINYIYNGSYIPDVNVIVPDTFNYFALYSVDQYITFPSNDYYNLNYSYSNNRRLLRSSQ